MKPILALAALAAAVVLLRRRKPMPEPDADDSEVVGMPTTWLGFDGATGNDATVYLRTFTLEPGARPHYWIEFAPTSDN